MSFSVENSKPFSVTVSIGVAEGTGHIEAIIKKADEALYEAKRSGKDRVITYTDKCE